MRVLSSICIVCACMLLTSCVEFIKMANEYQRDSAARYVREEREKEKKAEAEHKQEKIVTEIPSNDSLLETHAG